MDNAMTNYTIIGIDFGTSTTVVKVKNYYDGMKSNECQSLSVGGSTVVPTLVFETMVNGVKKLYFGHEAEVESGTGAEGVLYSNFKMDLLVPEKMEKAKELIREFMKYLYGLFSQQKAQLNVCPTVKTYISYPAKWTPEVIAFMKQSVVDAGFGTVETVFGETEPTAAIYATFTNHAEVLREHRLVSQDIPINVMMLDMGAGTSDVTIFRFMADKENKFHIGLDGKIISHPAIDNAYLCGGREVDRMLAAYNVEYLKRIFPGGVVPEGFLLKNESGVKAWKDSNVSRRLSENQTATVPGDLMTFLNMYKSMGLGLTIPAYPDIDRRVFEGITKEHWTQLHTLMSDAIAKASGIIPEIHGPEDIDLLIVTGGHSQWYCVREMCFGRPVAGLPPINFKKIIDTPERFIAEARPQETVANGLVFRDLSFDILHTSANNLWIQLSLNDNMKSDVYQVLEQFDVLPATKTIEWKQSISSGAFSFDNARLMCHCCYGNDMKTGVHSSLTTEAALNVFFDFLIKVVFLPFIIFDKKWNYDILVKLTVQVNPDGSARIDGLFNCNGNLKNFVMNL